MDADHQPWRYRQSSTKALIVSVGLGRNHRMHTAVHLTSRDRSHGYMLRTSRTDDVQEARYRRGGCLRVRRGRFHAGMYKLVACKTS